MTKIIFNNEPPSLDPYILDWDISVFHKEEKLFIFQSIELIETKENNNFYLEIGKCTNFNYLHTLISANTGRLANEIVYSIKVNSPFDFKKELQGVKVTAMENGFLPGKRLIITAMSGTYEKLVDL